MTRDHLETTSAYFDGELSDVEATAAAAHLATCAACQELLATAVGIDAVTHAPAKLVRVPKRTWRTAALVGGGALAAAAIALVVVAPWHRDEPSHPTQLALAHDRVVEARFSGSVFAPHRPYVALRGADAAREPITLATLAALEQRGDRADLVAALAATGELARATEAATALPDSTAAEVDRAAVALAAHQPELALDHAYRALDREPSSLAARWNLGLAARDLGLGHVARDAFVRVAAANEPGWSAEARTLAATISDELAPFERDYAAFEQRARTMLAGGAPLAVDDARRFPAFTRINFYDAVRLAPTRARLDALRPLAAVLDAGAVSPTATAAIDRIAPAHLAIRASFAADYRAVIERRLAPGDTGPLLERLAKAGVAVADLTVGVLVFTQQLASDHLAALVAPWHDPWFDLAVVRGRASARLAIHDLRAEPEIAEALASCSEHYAFRCGQLAVDLAVLHGATGLDGAESEATTALRWYRRAVAPSLVRTALATLADLHRMRGASSLARAEMEDVSLTTTGNTDCDVHRNAEFELADLAVAVAAWDRVRLTLPDPTPPPACLAPDDLLALGAASDLARHTGDARDIELAQRWIATLPVMPGEGRDGMVAAATLRIARDTATRDAARPAVTSWIARHASDHDAYVDGIRAWAIATLIDDAGATGDWRGAMDAAIGEHPHTAAVQACAVVASVDDDRVTIAAIHGGKVIGDHRIVPPQELGTAKLVPDAIAHELAACDAIQVFARPPLHGRADLLPRELPWFFVGDVSHASVRPLHAHTVEVVDAHPPASVGTTTLPAMRARDGFDVSLAGDAATPAATLAALASATYVELHVHGIVAPSDDGAAFLALSPDAHGEFALRGDAVRKVKLAGAPTVVLAACRASTVAPYLSRRWSLPDAFVAAGASAVIAVDRPIDDATARTVFDELRRRALANEPIERAVAAIRATATAPWAQRLMVFE